MLTYGLSDEAQADIESHYLYLAQRNPEAAQHLLESIVATLEQTCRFPEAAPRVIGTSEPSSVPGTRKLIEGEYRYVIYYRVTRDVLTVLRIFHPTQRR